MKTYNGHKNWNHWNVSLWINNDEELYRMANDCIAATRNHKSFSIGGYKPRDIAAQRMMERLEWADMVKTPDGAKYSVTTIRAAMRGM